MNKTLIRFVIAVVLTVTASSLMADWGCIWDEVNSCNPSGYGSNSWCCDTLYGCTPGAASGGQMFQGTCFCGTGDCFNGEL
jgi:hypothetical protein